MLIMIGMEDGRMLRLNETSTHTQNVAYLCHHGEGIIPSSVLLHARFVH